MELTPKQVVRELDRYIIVRTRPSAPSPLPCATAIAAAQLPEEIRDEIVPKNILMSARRA